MKGFLTLLLLVAISAGVFALGNIRSDSNGKSLIEVADDVALIVDVEVPERGNIARLVQAPGDIEAVLEVDISSEIVSKIVEMPIEEGDTVNAGDLLCRLDDKNLLADLESAEARIDQLKAALKQAEADLEKAIRDVELQASLSEQDATSDLELRDYLTVRKKAEALLEIRHCEMVQAQAYLKRVNEDLKKTIILSPIDGVISKLNAKQGEVVITGTMNNPGTVIMSISDLSKMQVRARVDEVDVPLVKPNQKGRIYLQSDPDSPVPARVVRVASKGTKILGRDVVTFETLLEVLSDDERIKPGMTANIEVEVDRNDDAVKIPVQAVVHRMRKDLPEYVIEEFDKKQAGVEISERVKRGQYIKVVYVMNEDKAEVRLVDCGIADTRQVEIIDGIDLVDTIITGPYRSLDQMKDGAKIALDDDKEKSTKPDAEAALAQNTQEGDEANATDNNAKPTSESKEQDDPSLASSTKP